jgi:hypothetical protein
MQDAYTGMESGMANAWTGKPLIYVDFEQGVRGFAAGDPGEVGTIRGEPVPGAIDFLLQATTRFSVVVCSPYCTSEMGVRTVSDWLRTHGAPVSELRFGAYRSVVHAGSEQVAEFSGRWPTIDELSALADGHRHG